jgi:hypothetical protein
MNNNNYDELQQKSFKLGQAYYKEHSDYPKHTVMPAFLNGVIFEERMSKCAFDGKIWNKSGNRKSL